MRGIIGIAASVLVTGAAMVSAQPSSPVRFLDVPYIQQSEALCGGAAAAMVMRYWGTTGVSAETFAPLVDRAAGGIRAEDLLDALRERGWHAQSFRGDAALIQARLADRQPLITLIEDRPGAFHFVVVVAWTNGRVVYHDPARAPFRVVDEQLFDVAWLKSDRWTMLALPPAFAKVSAGRPAAAKGSTGRPEVAKGSAGRPELAEGSAGGCDALVRRAVRSAESGNTTDALTLLSAAADLCPDASAPLREAAGVHALAGDWMSAAARAKEALARDRRDQHAWRILATSEYVSGDRDAALEAWNAIGEPRVDLVTVHGLSRTRHAVATALLGVTPDQPLTNRTLTAAARRLSELPSADVARVSYTPVGGGRANVDAVVLERRMLPTSRGSLAGMAVHMAADRELVVQASSMTGGGEVLRGAWRWWNARPRLSVSYALPSALGVWRAEAFGERQAYGSPQPSIVESRRGGSVSLSSWTSSLLRWEVAAGIDSWRDRGRATVLRAAVEQRLADERLSLHARGLLLAGSISAWTTGAELQARSGIRNEGMVLSGRAGVETTSSSAPLAFWPGAGTGHARGPLLRAHSLLEDGRITGDVFGRRLYHGGVEGRRWLPPLFKVIRIAPALFVDGARAERTMNGGRAWHVDAGAGLRIAVAGGSVLRVDVGRGLRDGRTALSMAWTR